VTRYEIDLTNEQAWAMSERPPTPERPDARYEALNIIVNAIRANPSKPPRMSEPGWGGVVIAGAHFNPTRRPFVRFLRSTDPNAGVWHDGYGAHPSLAWHELINPEPVP
jgi:hypothetical protein